MTEIRNPANKPERILLATDLGSRSDRALDRAVQLARHWQAELIVLHVADAADAARARRQDRDTPSWRRPLDPTRVIEAELRRELANELPSFRVKVEEGDPAQVVAECAERERCDLIVTGVARHSLFGRSLLGSTVDALVRLQTVPVLVVKRRAARPYEAVTIATDFSDPSRAALHLASRWFAEQRLSLFHSFEVPFAGLLDKGNFSESLRDMEKVTIEEFLDDPAISYQVRARMRVLVEYGKPEVMLRRYVEDTGIDLVVLGSNGRSKAFEAFIGSTAIRLLAELPSDMLVVRSAVA